MILKNEQLHCPKKETDILTSINIDRIGPD